MSSYLVLIAIGLLVVGTIFAFLAAGSVMKLKSSEELKVIVHSRSSAVRPGMIGLACIIASALLYQLSVSIGTPTSVFDCTLSRPFAPTTMNCIQRGIDSGEVGWVVRHEGSETLNAKGTGVTFSVQKPGDYIVESIVTTTGLFTRSGSSKATIKVQEPPPPQYVSRSIPFSIPVSSPRGEAEQSFQVGPGEKIVNANIQLHSSLPVSARIKSKTDQEVIVQVQSNVQCEHGPFGNCLNANLSGRAEGTLNLTIVRENK